MRTKLARAFAVPMLALSLLCGSVVHAVAQTTTRETITVTVERTIVNPDGSTTIRETRTYTVERTVS
jgi:hypothetical protein